MINLFCLFFLVWSYFRRKRAGGILFQIWRHFLLQSTSPYFTKVKPDVRDNLDASSRLLTTMNMLSKFDRPCLVLNSIGHQVLRCTGTRSLTCRKQFLNFVRDGAFVPHICHSSTLCFVVKMIQLDLFQLYRIVQELALAVSD